MQKAFSDLKSTLFNLAKAESERGQPENALKIAETLFSIDSGFLGVEGLWKTIAQKLVDSCIKYSTTPQANTDLHRLSGSIIDPKFGQLVKEQLLRLVASLPWITNADGYADIMSQAGTLEAGAKLDVIRFTSAHLKFRTTAIPKSIADEWQNRVQTKQSDATGLP